MSFLGMGGGQQRPGLNIANSGTMSGRGILAHGQGIEGQAEASGVAVAAKKKKRSILSQTNLTGGKARFGEDDVGQKSLLGQ